MSFLSIVSFMILNSNQAHGEPNKAPGLPIARLALPSLPTNNDFTSSTGTHVGGIVIEFNRMLRETEMRAAVIVQSTRDLYENAIAEVNQYHLITSEIEAKLQLGTTPGNPILIELRKKANAQLNQIMNTIGKMDGLANEFFQNSSQMKVLLSNIKNTLLLPGAVDEDHAHLILMSDELEKVQREVLQALETLNANAKRQNEWLAAEREHLANLSLAVDRGSTLPLKSEKLLSYPMPIALPELSPPLKEPELVVQTPPALNEVKTAPLPLVESAAEEPEEEVVQNIVAPEPMEPLPLVAVESRSEAKPLPEEEVVLPPQEQNQTPQQRQTLSAVSKGRTPLGSIDVNQDLRAQKWYIFSTAKRGLNNRSNMIEIVNVVEEKTNPNTRGEEVKNLLVDMGLNPSQLQVINVKREEDQGEQVLLFSEK
ncbi:MAG: hypothetical protein JSR85_08010 [Proteobacteria bacterium]|nr:hypothetical protein [Pseudomonadota bacterium]